MKLWPNSTFKDIRYVRTKLELRDQHDLFPQHHHHPYEWQPAGSASSIRGCSKWQLAACVAATSDSRYPERQRTCFLCLPTSYCSPPWTGQNMASSKRSRASSDTCAVTPGSPRVTRGLASTSAPKTWLCSARSLCSASHESRSAQTSSTRSATGRSSVGERWPKHCTISAPTRTAGKRLCSARTTSSISYLTAENVRSN